MPLGGIVQLWEKSGVQGEKWMLGVWWALWIGSLASRNLAPRLTGQGAEYLAVMGLAGLVLAGLFAVVVVARITNAARNLGRAT